MTKSFISDAALLVGILDYEASLPTGSVALLPVPSRRAKRPAWVMLGVALMEDSEGQEWLGPVRRVRLLWADNGSVHEEVYAGPAVMAAGEAGSRELRARLQREMPLAGNAFFAGKPAQATWMRVALHNVFVGDLWLALAAVAPDFLAWLADSPADQA